jgi:hypothetical protein
MMAIAIAANDYVISVVPVPQVPECCRAATALPSIWVKGLDFKSYVEVGKLR